MAGKRSARRRFAWSAPASGHWQGKRSRPSPHSIGKWPPIWRGRGRIRSILASSPTWSGSSRPDTMPSIARGGSRVRRCRITSCATSRPRWCSRGSMCCSLFCSSRCRPLWATSWCASGRRWPRSSCPPRWWPAPRPRRRIWRRDAATPKRVRKTAHRWPRSSSPTTSRCHSGRLSAGSPPACSPPGCCLQMG